MEIEGFREILACVKLARELREIGRFGIVEKQFAKTLHYDSYYENVCEVLSSVFNHFYNSYDENEEVETMIFEDALFSNYFIRAFEYGKQHKLTHKNNPYVTQAQEEVRRWLNYSHCTDWKLLAYTKTEKTARESKLVVYNYTSCGCNSHEHIAYGLIQIYNWFFNKCAEFAPREVMAA